MSLPATKGFEIGSGFAGTRPNAAREHNDAFVMEDGRVRTTTQSLAAASRAASATASRSSSASPSSRPRPFSKPQQTVTTTGEATELQARGRHDPCVLPRAVPMVEAMAALVLCDHALRQRGQCGCRVVRRKRSLILKRR